jgi:hypothetical protein
VLDRLNANGRHAEIFWNGSAFATGDKVVIRKNRKNNDDSRLNSWNGEIGTLEVCFDGQYQDISKDDILLIVHLSSGQDRVFTKSEVTFGKVLEHAYAFTIHFAQGLEFPRVVAVFTDTAVVGGQAESVRARYASAAMRYTARTRAKQEYVEYVESAVMQYGDQYTSLDMSNILGSLISHVNHAISENDREKHLAIYHQVLLVGYYYFSGSVATLQKWVA